jgi:hypothetical protein
MAKRKRSAAAPLPVLITELILSSWETIFYRTWMMAMGTCSPAEYHRMFREKARAALASGVALGGGGIASAIAPWHRRATANARRLRKW